MAYKNVSLSVEAYDALKRLQRNGESFSSAVLRIAERERGSITEVAGILTNEQADSWKKGVMRVRKSWTVRQW